MARIAMEQWLLWKKDSLFIKSVTHDKVAKFQWKVRDPRICRPHKLLLIYKRKKKSQSWENKEMGAWNWEYVGEIGKYDQNSFYEILKT